MSLFLFDNDGTLVKGLGPYETSLEQAIKQEFNKTVKIDLTHFHGLTDRTTLREILKENNMNYDENSIDRCLANFGSTYVASRDEVKILPTVKETLLTLKQRGHFLAVVTGNVEEMARKKLSLYKLNRYLPFGAFGEESYERNDLVSMAISRARERNWKGNNKDIYVVGDTNRDIESARYAEVRAIGITTGKASRQELEKAVAYKVIDKLIELTNL